MSNTARHTTRHTTRHIARYKAVWLMDAVRHTLTCLWSCSCSWCDSCCIWSCRPATSPAAMLRAACSRLWHSSASPVLAASLLCRSWMVDWAKACTCTEHQKNMTSALLMNKWPSCVGFVSATHHVWTNHCWSAALQLWCGLLRLDTQFSLDSGFVVQLWQVNLACCNQHQRLEHDP